MTESVTFYHGPRICWCSRCQCPVRETDVICESCGASLSPTESGMVVTGVDRENGIVTIEEQTMHQPTKCGGKGKGKGKGK